MTAGARLAERDGRRIFMPFRSARTAVARRRRDDAGAPAYCRAFQDMTLLAALTASKPANTRAVEMRCRRMMILGRCDGREYFDIIAGAIMAVDMRRRRRGGRCRHRLSC